MEIAALISSLPNDWKVTNAGGKTKTKNDLMRCTYGAEKEADNILYFEVAILNKHPPPQKVVSQFDSMLVEQINVDSRLWRHNVLNFIFLEELTEPLQHPTSVFLIHTSSHFVTLVVDREKYYFYDSLKRNPYVPKVVKKIHNALNLWYDDNKKDRPVVLQQAQKINKESVPLQEDVWTCGMHMLMVALATIYQGKKPVLNYTKEHAYLLSKAHLYFELTGEVLPFVSEVIDILKLGATVSIYLLIVLPKYF